MAKRNIVAEIALIKSRGQRAATNLHHDLRTLQRTWKNAKAERQEADDFYPIRAVTLLEVFSRAWIAQLIDRGAPYASNAEELAKNIKLDFDVFRAVHGRTITLGDVVAHNLSLNSFRQVCQHFTTLLGKDFLPSITRAISREITLADLMTAEPRARNPVISDLDQMCKSLSRLYEVRHILCHEAPSRNVYEPHEIDGFLEAAAEFAGATHATLTILLYDGRPDVSYLDYMNSMAMELERLDSEVARLLVAAKPFAGRHAKRSQGIWLAFREASCDSKGSETPKHNLSHLARLLEAVAVTKDRIAQLKRWIPGEGE